MILRLIFNIHVNHKVMTELIYKEETFKVIGTCMEIHKTLGMGLKEINYKDAMEIEFISQNIRMNERKDIR